MNSGNGIAGEARWRVALIALSVAVGLQVMRPFFVLDVYNFGERHGLSLAAIPALIVFLTPFLTPLLARLLSPNRAIVVTLGGLALARVVLQVSPSGTFSLIVAGIGSALALTSLPLGLIWARASDDAASYHFATAIFLGMALDTALNNAFLTWDYVWQPGIVPLALALILSAGIGAALWRLRATLPETWQETNFRTALPLALLGPFFALQMLLLQNAPFVASVTGLSMPLASGVVLIGNVVGVVAIGWLPGRPVPLPMGVVGLAAMTILPYAILTINGAIMALLALVAQALAAGLLWTALTGRTPASAMPAVRRTSAAIGLGSLCFGLLAILYYIAYNINLPFPNTILPSVAGFLLGLAAFINVRDTSHLVLDRRLAALPAAMLVVPVLLLLTRPAVSAEPLMANSFRLVDYNIHQAVNTDGQVNPEAIVQLIEAQNPDVVTVQEVTRGWLISGSLDLAEWLSMRLKMPYYYAPAADGQFGSLILSRIQVADVETGALPRGGVPMARSYLRATLDSGADPVIILATHLHQITEDTAVRIPQAQKVVEVWNQTARTVVVGDMNGRPGEADIAVYLDAGLVSAQDAVGDPSALTFISSDQLERERIDWIFGSPDVQFSDFVIGDSRASDHLPLAVTVMLP